MDVKSCLWGMVPFAAMVIVECTDVGITTLSKAAMLNGMSSFVFIVYYNALGTLILLPYFIFHRAKGLPFTFFLLCKFFLLALIGFCFSQMLAFIGIKDSSPALASAMANIIPALTFVLAIIFRMEKLDLRSSSSQAKTLGAIASIAGAFVVTLYEGPPIISTTSPSSNSAQQLLLPSAQKEWVLGGILLAINCFAVAIWNIFQTAIVKEYPEKMTIVFFYCLFGTIQSAIVALIAERNNPDAWRLRPDIELITIVYSAIFGSVFHSGVHTWCLHMKGPVYVAMFKPLGIVIAVILGVMFLGDILYLGSVIGAIVIVVGFYAVMWGQDKQEKMVEANGMSSLESSTQRIPLLQSKIEEIN